MPPTATITPVRENMVGHLDLRIITGIASVAFSGAFDNPDDWVRVSGSFLVGAPNKDKPIAYATIVVPSSFDVVDLKSGIPGWAVDASYSEYDDATQLIRVYVQLAVKNTNSEVLGVAFQVSLEYPYSPVTIVEVTQPLGAA